MRLFLVLLGAAVLVGVLLLGGRALSSRQHEGFQLEKIDFLVWSAEHEDGSPFTADMIATYLKAMGDNVSYERTGLAFHIVYDGRFFDREWRVVATQ